MKTLAIKTTAFSCVCAPPFVLIAIFSIVQEIRIVAKRSLSKKQKTKTKTKNPLVLFFCELRMMTPT